MSELAALFGFGGGPGDGTLADGSRDGELVVPALAVAEPDPVELAVAVGLEEAEGVGLAVAVGDVAGAELALGVGVGDVERVGLGVDAGGEDVEGAGLSLAVGPGLVLAAAGEEEGEGEEATGLANAGSCEPTEGPKTRKLPVTRPAATARRCATDM